MEDTYLKYCEATHPQSEDGCFEAPGHEGQHRGWTGDEPKEFYWDHQTDLPTTLFTDEELAILITALQPVKHFFPNLQAKLEQAREASK